MLVAFDSIGGQALFQQDDDWFRIAADEDWTPRKLPDRRSAVRCTLLAPYEIRHESYSDCEALVVALEKKWDADSRTEDVPLAEIVHLFPKNMQRAWQTQKEERNREERRLFGQAQQLRGWEQTGLDLPRVSSSRAPASSLVLAQPMWEWAPRAKIRAKLRTAEAVSWGGAEEDFWRTVVQYARRAAARFLPELSVLAFPEPPVLDIEDLAAETVLRLVCYVGFNKVRYEELRSAEPRLQSYVGATTRWLGFRSLGRGWLSGEFIETRSRSALDSTITDPQAKSQYQHIRRRERFEALFRALQLLNPPDAVCYHAVCNNDAIFPYAGDSKSRRAIDAAADDLGLSVAGFLRRRTRMLKSLRTALEDLGFGAEDFF